MAKASDKQIAFIRSLMVQVGVPQAEADAADFTGVDVKTASATIDALMDTKKKQAAARPASAEAPEGIHYFDGRVFKVQVAHHGSGKIYAKSLNPNNGEWVYEGRSPLRNLSASTLMTVEQAAEFGHLYGICARCGAVLTDEGSISRGMGPYCAKQF